MRLEIFDVEHGACSLFTADNGNHAMIDCGHNASTQWYPGTQLRARNETELELLTITNYDEDHVSGAENLFDNIHVRWLQRNKSVSTDVISRLKSDTGMGRGMKRLCHEIDNTYTSSSTATSKPDLGNLGRKVWNNKYPTFDDENNLSLAVLFKAYGISILFCGDLENAGWLELLKQPEFKFALNSVNVLMAPHHGRESGCCKEAMELMNNLFYVVISDRGYQYDTQKTIPFYSKYAQGGPFRDQTRKVLTTRKDGTIVFNFDNGAWGPM